MTTKDKGITLPAQGQYVDTSLAVGVNVTNVASNYAIPAAYNYGASVMQPVNLAPLTAVTPVGLIIKAQNATALLAASGAGVTIEAGVGTGGNVDGNVQLCNTSGLGAGWNTAHLILGGNFHFWIDAKNRLRFKASPPANDTDGNVVSLDLSNTGAYDPPNLADGAGVTTTLAVASAVLGDLTLTSFSLDLQGILLTSYVSSAGVVSIRFQNESGGAIDLANGTLTVKVIKQ